MVTRVPIYLGGTGESTQAAAQAALGLHTSNSVAFTTVTIGAVNVLANDYATLLSAYSNDVTTLATARGNDHATLLSAYSNDVTTLATARGNDHATLLSAYSNDVTTLATARGNDHATLLSAYSNDGATLATARGNDHATLLSAYSNDVTTLATARGNDHATLISATTNPIITGNVLINSNSANDALRINQIGSGNAFVVEDSANPDATPFVIDYSGNVGIGTGSPAQRLHITTTAAPSGTTQTFLRATGDLGYGADFGGGIIQGVGGIATISTVDNGTATERMRIDSSGNVGIGNTSPTAKLHVTAGSTTSASLTWGAAAGQIFRNEDSELAIGLLNVSPYPLWMQGRTSLSAARDIVLQPSGGNVGIGTSSPTNKLEVHDQTNAGFLLSQFNDTDGAVIRGRRYRGTIASPSSVLANDVLLGFRAFGYTNASAMSSVSASIDLVASENFTSTALGSFIRFRTTGTGSTVSVDRMRIDSSGNVGIGTTAPAATLDVVGSFSDAQANTLSQTLTDAATIAWDTSLGRIATVTLGASRTFGAPTNIKVGTYILHVIQGGTGSYTITWNGVFKWTAATAPTLSTAVGRRDVFSFISDGTNLYGAMIPDVR